MPRDSSGVFSLPSGTAPIAKQTATAADVGARFTDLETDANTERPVVSGGTGAATPAAARANLGLVIGTDVQGHSAILTDIEALGTAADMMLYTTGESTWAEASITAAGRALLDDADASAQRTTLGLGDMATQNEADLIGGTTVWENGTNILERLISASKLRAAVYAAMDAKSYQSAETTVSNGSETVFAHGLGAIPDMTSVELVCTTAENGYSVGDRIQADGSSSISNSPRGFVVIKDATNVTIRIGTSGIGRYIRKDTFDEASFDAANWDIVVRAMNFS